MRRIVTCKIRRFIDVTGISSGYWQSFNTDPRNRISTSPVGLITAFKLRCNGEIMHLQLP